MFQDRLTAWFSPAPASAPAAVACCHGSFAAVPASLLGNASSSSQALQQIYQAAFDAARRQIARRAVIESWQVSLN